MENYPSLGHHSNNTAASSAKLEPVVFKFQRDHLSPSDLVGSGANVCDLREHAWEGESHVVLP